MKPIKLSINPSYHCNFRCDFCYLTPDQLSDRNLLPLINLEKRLQELWDSGHSIEHVDLYGGEIALLPEDYLEELDSILLKFGDPQINIISNLSKIHPYFLKEHIDLSVSFDFEAREKYDQVLKNIISIGKEVSILMLASPRLMNIDINYMISMFNQISNIRSVEIKPYSSNQSNQLAIKDSDFEDFIKKWLVKLDSMRFRFINRDLIEQSLARNRNSYSDDHVYITPHGKYAVLEFDENGHEYFHELHSIKNYQDWAQNEKIRVASNHHCQQCSYLGHCLTEHYREVKDLANSCNGFKLLLDWYQDQKLEFHQQLNRSNLY